MNTFKRVMSLGLLAALAAGCQENKTVTEPEAADFAEYVKAYTGGVLGADATIAIELALDAESMPTEGIFSFDPQLSGTTTWESKTVVKFKPEALEPGQTYRAEFRLGEVLKKAEVKKPEEGGMDKVLSNLGKRGKQKEQAASGVPQTFSFGFSVKKPAPAPETVEEAKQVQGDGFRVKSANLGELWFEGHLRYRLYSAISLNGNLLFRHIIVCGLEEQGMLTFRKTFRLINRSSTDTLSVNEDFRSAWRRTQT